MADLIRSEKRALQEKLEPDELPWIMKHPDLPGNEDCVVLGLTYWIACRVRSRTRSH